MRPLDQAAKCELDGDGALSVQDILLAFNGPLNEEQAWAIAYQTAVTIQRVGWNRDLYLISTPAHLSINKDGSIHEKTVLSSEGKRKLSSNRSEIISSLGVALFKALDYGLSSDEERPLESNLEHLIERIVNAKEVVGQSERSAEEEKEDEGIEWDSSEDDSSHITPHLVMRLCEGHLECPETADGHYKAVCRALVAETLELSSFLNKIQLGTKELRKSSHVIEGNKCQETERSLEQLCLGDWARLWMQVIRELRQGVKLKKVEFNEFGHQMEFELTPYEMLLDDIRLKRYRLNKVMINGELPQRVKKDAHALILDFIRSRPPLVPASKRTLKPAPPKEETLYERLMDSIRQGHKLRPTPPNPTIQKSSLHLGRVYTPDERVEELKRRSRRRLIKADLTWSNEFKFDDGAAAAATGTENVIVGGSVMTGGQRETDSQLIDSDPLFVGDRIRKKFRPESGQSTSSTNSFSRRFSLKNLSKMWSTPEAGMKSNSSPLSNSKSTTHIAELNSNTSMTLQEVQHIRCVLSKAELESRRNSHMEDLDKGRICFICMRVKFSFFTNRPNKCCLCERYVCEKCTKRINVPEDQWLTLPVNRFSMLSAGVRTSDTRMGLKRSNTMTRIDVGKKLAERRLSDVQERDFGLNLETGRKSMIKICKDCRTFIVHVARNSVSSSTSSSSSYNNSSSSSSSSNNSSPTINPGGCSPHHRTRRKSSSSGNGNWNNFKDPKSISDAVPIESSL